MLLSFPNQNIGCPVLAFFARAGVITLRYIALMPRGLHRYYGSHDLHFITCSCYRRRQGLRTAPRVPLQSSWCLMDVARAGLSEQLFPHVSPRRANSRTAVESDGAQRVALFDVVEIGFVLDWIG